MRSRFRLRATGVFAMALAAAPCAGAPGETSGPIVIKTTIPLTLPPSSLGPTVTFGIEGGRVFVGARGGTACRLAVLSATSLRLLADAPVGCDDPRLDGERVMPIETVSRGGPTGTVRIAVREAATGTVKLGPVVMHYPNISDGRPEWVYGGGSLWLYDVGSPAASGAPAIPSEALRVSTRTGAVLQRVAMPALSRIVLAADQDGLWFGPSLETGWPPQHPPALLYFVPLGASHPTVLRSAPTAAHLNWLVAAGHTTWVSWKADRGGIGASTTATFRSPRRPARLVRVAPSKSAPLDIGEGSYDTAPVLDLPTVGLVAAEPGWLETLGTAGTSTEAIVALDPATGGKRTFARITTRPAGTLEGNVVAQDSLYLLEAARGSSVILYRIASSSPSGTSPR